MANKYFKKVITYHLYDELDYNAGDATAAINHSVILQRNVRTRITKISAIVRNTEYEKIPTATISCIAQISGYLMASNSIIEYDNVLAGKAPFANNSLLLLSENPQDVDLYVPSNQNFTLTALYYMNPLINIDGTLRVSFIITAEMY
jgi:hypothetical protein